jgi:hypothetical protein
LLRKLNSGREDFLPWAVCLKRRGQIDVSKDSKSKSPIKPYLLEQRIGRHQRRLTPSIMSEEEDYGALIYRESQLRKAEAAAAAAAAVAKDVKKKKTSTTTRRRATTTSSRAKSAAVTSKNVVTAAKEKSRSKKKRALAAVDEELGRKRSQRKRYKYTCSADGCTNHAAKGGVCIKHGAKVKRCSSEGCTNHAKKGGVCIRHGAKFKRCSSEGCVNIAKKGGVCVNAKKEGINSG